MNFNIPAKDQPNLFEFSKENRRKIDEIVEKYPQGKQQSAVIPLLDIAQRQHGGWIPTAAMNEIAKILDMPYIKVYEVASFYSMFNLSPIGKHFIQVCRTTPCWLRGSDDISEACKKRLGVGLGETSNDGKFTLIEVECLGACANAPMVQIDDDYYEDLTPESIVNILDKLSIGEKPKTGSQVRRNTSEPSGELTSLKKVGAKNSA